MDAESMIRDWPFPIGESPFHIKGTAVKGVFDRTKKALPGGFAAVLTAASSPGLERLASQPLLMCNMYDVFAVCIVDYYAAKLLHVGFHDYVYKSAIAQFDHDLNGVYRFLLRVMSSQAVVERLARVTGTYFDFSPIRVHRVAAHSAELAREDFPELLVPWYRPVTEGYVGAALAATGAKVIDRRFTAESTGKKRDGVTLVNIRFAVEWQ